MLRLGTGDDAFDIANVEKAMEEAEDGAVVSGAAGDDEEGGDGHHPGAERDPGRGAAGRRRRGS